MLWTVVVYCSRTLQRSHAGSKIYLLNRPNFILHNDTVSFHRRILVCVAVELYLLDQNKLGTVWNTTEPDCFIRLTFESTYTSLYA